MLSGKELGEAIASAIRKKLESGAVKSKADIARHFGVRLPSLYTWTKKGAISKEKLPELFRYFSDVVGPDHWGIPSEWLANAKPLDEANLDDNVSPGPDVVGMVPVISWVAAGRWTEICNVKEPYEADEWVPCPKSHSKNTFGLRIQGLSMYNPNGRRSYAEGEVIIVDPARGADNGSRVVVRLNDSNEATFKQLVVDGNKQYLMALNPDWPERFMELKEDAEIVGVVIGTWRPE